MTAANRLGLYSAFLACNAIFFRSSFTPMLTVLEAMWSSSWRLNVKESKPNNVLELRNDFWGCCRLVGCRRWRRWWGYWSIHWPFKKKWLWCLAQHPQHLSTWCLLGVSYKHRWMKGTGWVVLRLLDFHASSPEDPLMYKYKSADSCHFHRWWSVVQLPCKWSGLSQK